MRTLVLAIFATLLFVPAAQAQQTTYTIANSASSYSNSAVAKGNRFTLYGDGVVLDMIEPYMGGSGISATIAVWHETATNVWTEIWSDSVYVNGTGYLTTYPNIVLDPYETYAIGFHFSGTATYYWTSSSQSDPVWGNADGYLTIDGSTYPSTISGAYLSTGGYKMRITATTVSDGDGDGWDAADDCDDSDPNVYPGAIELCNGEDDDCDGYLEYDEQDNDFDGVMEREGDCDPNQGATYPGAPELCDSQDNDCDGDTDEGLSTDYDGDGYSSSGSCEGTADDCDDNDADINSGAAEVCDYIDNDCDFDVDEGFVYDDDGDGFVVPECGGDDCDDFNADTYPGAAELCDGEDNDCSGDAPDDELTDEDGDGETACTDCDDNNADVHTGQTEDCSNGIDDNCNGEIDEASDNDGDGYGACDDCNDADPDINPGAEEDDCNGVDDDCDGELDPQEEDLDDDGFRPCDGDCEDDNALVFPDAEEVCDGFDNDCDGELHPEEGDENDADGDGIPICFDCDDDNPDIYPGAPEDVCEELDADCDGVTPDGSDDECSSGGGGGGARRSSCSAAGASASPLALLLLLGVRRRR